MQTCRKDIFKTTKISLWRRLMQHACYLETKLPSMTLRVLSTRNADLAVELEKISKVFERSKRIKVEEQNGFEIVKKSSFKKQKMACRNLRCLHMEATNYLVWPIRFTPQFGNRGTSRSDVKTRTVQACKSVVVRRATNMHAQSGVWPLKLLEAYDNVTTPTEQICQVLR